MTISQAFDLALQHHRAGRLPEAEALYRQILAAEPNHADALHLLGVVAHQAGRDDLAVDLIRQSIALNPNNPAAHSNLGEACRRTGRLEEAIAACRRALELNPDHAEACFNLGNALNHLGRLDDAIAMYRRGLELKPIHADAHNNLGLALACQGQLDEAVAAYRRAIQLQPGLTEAYNNLGNALCDQGELDQAIAVYRNVIQIEPYHSVANSNLLYTLHFRPGDNAGAIFEERQRWNRQFSEPSRPFILPHANDCNPRRSLRIGYVSPAFWDHVVGRNLLPLFENHDLRNFEILCYSGGAQQDKLTEEFRRHAQRWRSTVGVSDEALADRIRRDGVDILVDLTQHMAGNRLPMFARKPAPVQVSFAGYPESAGLESIEYRISDRYLETGSEEMETARKEHVFLIDSFWCYAPSEVAVEVKGLPAKESGKVTFGCLNNFCKVNEQLLSLWARVLRKVTDSRLVILCGVGSQRERTLEVLESKGVGARRVEFAECRPRREYLDLYHRLDIALDTFPYNGHTTSLDALWMGVPVVSLAGGAPVSRAGLSQLTNLGLPELVAHSEEDFVRIAVELAGDLPRLAELRATLRQRMLASPLMDAPRFARNVEAAYRSMWERWCAGQSPIGEK